MAHDERTRAWAEGFLLLASAEGKPERIADELFRFADAFERSDELQNVLGDPRIPAARRQQIVEDLLGGKAHPLTVGMISAAVTAGRARDLPKVASALGELVARGAGRQVAEVRVVTELSDEQKERLRRALGEAVGSEVDLRVLVDPSVLGGVVARIGDTVIDGSLRSRVQKLRKVV